MRYTTIIDITEARAIYRNQNARLIYLHMVLKSGYHDQDRDIIEISIRCLAMATGLTVSATRHALIQLERAGLIARQGTTWSVKKFIIDEKPTPRAKTKQQQQQLEQAAERRKTQQQRDAEMTQERQQREQNYSAGKTSYMLWYEAEQVKAAHGDIDAQKTIERNRAAYERQCEMMNQNKIK